MTGMPRGVTQSTGYPESATFLADMVNQSYMTDVNGRGQMGVVTCMARAFLNISLRLSKT